MYVVYGRAELFFPYCSSLKEKRKILNSIIDRIRKRFNVSIAEVGHHDLWQRSILGFSAVASSHKDLDFISDIVIETIELHINSVQLTSFSKDIIT